MRSPVLTVLLTGVLGLTGSLTGCSEEEPAPEPAPTEEAGPPAWNPCSGIDVETVSTLLETAYVVRTGTAESPTCTFTPDVDGEPVVDVNYQTFPGSLTELLDTFGAEQEPGRTRITSPEVDGADDARAPRGIAEAMHAAIPGSDLVLVPGAGHDVNLEAPQEFQVTVHSFLRAAASQNHGA